jgi:hypothetical protein
MAYSLDELYRAALTGQGTGDIDFGKDNAASILTTLLANQAQMQVTGMTNATNYKINQETNQLNRELAQKQQDFDLMMWNKTNEYNSPEHQMELFREAGINPLAAYGSIVGNTSASNLVSPDLANQVATTMQAPQLQSPTIFPETPWALEAFKGVAQVSKDFADTMYKFDDLSNTKSGTASQNALNYAKANEVRTNNKLLEYNLNNTLPQQLNSSIADMQRTYQEIENLKKQGKNTDSLTEVYNEQRKKTYYEALYSLKQVSYYDKDYKLRLRNTVSGERQASAAESQADAAHENVSKSWSGLVSRIMDDAGVYNLTVDALKGMVDRFNHSNDSYELGFALSDYLGKRIENVYRNGGDITEYAKMAAIVAGGMSSLPHVLGTKLGSDINDRLNGNMPVTNPSGF